MRVTLTADAINSQALCSCLAAANDHVAAGRTGTDDQGGFASSNSSRSNCATEALHEPALPAHEAWLAGLQRNRPRVHWAVLTTVVTAAAWLVANAVPFFSDLVGLIGGLTQAPLSLLLPTVLYRRIARPLGPVHGVTTLLIVAAASLLVLYGTSSALSKIALDWTSFGQPFACGQNMPDEGASISRLPTRKAHETHAPNGTGSLTHPSRELIAGQRQRTPPHLGLNRTSSMHGRGHAHRQQHLLHR